MEETSNGRLEEIQKVETLDGDKEVVIEHSGEFKTEAKSLREIVVHGNSESVNENHEGDDPSSHSRRSDEEAEPNENSTENEGSGEVKEEINVRESVVDSVESEVSSPSEELTTEGVQPVEKLEASYDIAESESKKIEDNTSQSLDEINKVSVEATNEDSTVIEEAIFPSTDENDGPSHVERKVVSKTIEKITMPLSEGKGIRETPFSSEKKVIEEITLPSPRENCEAPLATADVVSKAIEETKLPDSEQNLVEPSGTAHEESNEKVDESLREAANTGTVDTNKTKLPASTGNPPIISLTQRTIRTTSWRSCCGLLEILRHSDR